MRAMLIQTLINLTYDMDCIGAEEEISEQIAMLTDSDLEDLITEYLSTM